jgi:hypothetical protein
MKRTTSWDYTGAQTASSKVEYYYEPQGGVRYGNQTHVLAYDDAEADLPYRTTVTSYTVNTDPAAWMVDRPSQVRVFAGSHVTGTLVSQARYYYDYSTDWGAVPGQGLLTMEEQVDLDDPPASPRTATPSTT